MESAQADLERSRLVRISILERALIEECVPGCGRSWHAQTEDILRQNQIPRETFSTAIRHLLQGG